MTHPHTMPSKEFTLLMALLMSVVAITIDALLPALGMIGAELKVAHPNQVQLVIGFIFAGMALGQLVAGPLSDALGRKPVLYGGLALYLMGSVFCYFADSFELLLAGRLIQGLGVAAPYVTAVSVVRDKYSGRHMAQVMSLVMMIFILVPAIAPTLGQVMIHMGGWRSIFMLYIGYALVIGGWIMFRLEETLPPERRMPFRFSAFKHSLKIILSNRTTTLYMISMGLMFGSFIGYLGASQQIFQDQYGTGEKFSLYFGALALVLGAASLTNSKFVMRFGMRNIALNAMAVVVAASAFFVALHGMAAAVTLPMFMGYATVIFFCFGLMFGNLNSVAMEPMGEVAGMASALIGCVSSLISLSLGTFIGQMYDGTMLPIAMGFMVLNGMAWLLMKLEYKSYSPAVMK
jgi:DHA1 family bicyclomycin/chloramphenicol resistance-like MFS transporter